MKTRTASLRHLLCVAVLLAGCAGGQKPGPVAPAGSPVQAWGRLQVCGPHVCSQDGKPVQLRGMSLFWSNSGWGAERFFQAKAVETLVDSWHATVVRVPLGVQNDGGYLSDGPANEARLRAVVDAAIARGVYVIVDWHSHALLQEEAVEFFSRLARAYAGVPNLIWETYNEPMRHDWLDELTPYHEAVIAAIRKAGSPNLVVVGTPAWSQDVDSAALDPITMDRNVAYSLHFYAGTHRQSLRDKADFAMKHGVAVFVTEWGSCNSAGAGDVDAVESRKWMEWMDANQVSSCNWSLNDKAETASALLAGGPSAGWTESQLTPSGALSRAYILAGKP